MTARCGLPVLATLAKGSALQSKSESAFHSQVDRARNARLWPVLSSRWRRVACSLSQPPGTATVDGRADNLATGRCFRRSSSVQRTERPTHSSMRLFTTTSGREGRRSATTRKRLQLFLDDVKLQSLFLWRYYLNHVTFEWDRIITQFTVSY